MSGFGFDIPTPQPSNAVIGLNNEAIDPSAVFGEVFGSAAPQISAAAPASIAPELLAKDVLPELGANTQGRAPVNERELRNSLREYKEQQEILSGLPVSKAELQSIEPEVKLEEIDSLLDQASSMLGANPPQRSEFQDQGETWQQQMQRFSQNPLQYWKDSFKETTASMRAGLANTKEGKLKGFQNVWNDPETGASAAWKDGKIYVKYPNSNGYVPVGEKKFDVLQNYFLKMLGEFTGPIIEGVAGTGTEIAMGLGGAALSRVSPVAGGAVLAATPGVAGVAGVAAREGVKRGFDAVYGGDLSPEESEDLTNEMLWAAGINYGMSGLAFAGPKLWKGFKGAVESPITAYSRMDAVKQYFKEYAKKLSAGRASGSLAEGGAEAFGAIDSASKKLIKDVSIVEQAALRRAGKDQKFSMRNTLKSMEETLDDFGAHIDPNTGKVTFPEDIAEAEAGLMQEMGSTVGADDASLALKAEQGKTETAFGQLGGKKELRRIADLYEQLAAMDKTGGADLKTLMRYLDAFNFEGDLAKVIERPGELTNAFRRFRNASAMDRAAALEKTLVGSGLPEEDLFRSAYRQFAESIDDQKAIMKVFESQKSTENFIRQTGKQSETVKMIAKELGTESPMWKRYKGEFLLDMVKESTDPSKGIFDGADFVKKLMALPEGSRNTLFTKEEVKDLVAMARAAQKLPATNLLDARTKLDAATIAGFMKGSFLSSKIKAFMYMTGRNYDVMKYLVDDGIFDAIRKSGTKAEKKELAAARRYMEDMMQQMRVAEVTRMGKPVRVLVPYAAGRALIQVGSKEKMLDKAMDNVKETGMLFYPPNEEPEI